METLSYTIPNIRCGGCTHAIEVEVGELEGVNSVEASVAEKSVAIKFRFPASEDQIIGRLIEIEYSPTFE